jgi:hypothetical protein
MPSQILYFEEYIHVTPSGVVFHPHFDLDANQWYISQISMTLKDVGRLCGLDEEEITMLGLRYGKGAKQVAHLLQD